MPCVGSHMCFQSNSAVKQLFSSAGPIIHFKFTLICECLFTLPTFKWLVVFVISHVSSNHFTCQTASLLVGPLMPLQITLICEWFFTLWIVKWLTLCGFSHESSKQLSNQRAYLQCGFSHALWNCDHLRMLFHLVNNPMAGPVWVLSWVFKKTRQSNSFSPMWFLSCLFKIVLIWECFLTLWTVQLLALCGLS